MTPLVMEIQNFGSFQGAHKVELNALGLVSVLGRNGSGKSTAATDALLYGLYGETGPRKETLKGGGLKADDVVNEVVGADTLVAVTFLGKEDRCYRVERWRKDSSREKSQGVILWEDVPEAGGWTAVADVDSDNVQDHINAVVGMDYELATRVIVRSQEDPFNFAQATPKERFDILTTIEGVGELDARARVARDLAQELVVKAASVTGDIGSTKSALELYKSEDHAEKIREWEEARAKRLVAAQQAVAEDAAARERMTVEVAQLPALEKAFTDAEEALGALEYATKPEGWDDWQQHLGTLRAQAATAEQHYNSVVVRLGKLQAAPSNICQECGQAVTVEHMEHHRAAMESEATRFQHDVIRIRGEIQKAEETIQGVEEQTKARDAQLTATRKELGNALMTARDARNQAVACREALADTTRAQQLQEAVTLVETEPNPHANQQTQVAARVAELETKLDGLVEEKDKIALKGQLLAWWIRHIPSLKSWIFDSVVGEITAEANRWLGLLMGGKCWVQIDSTTLTKSGDVRDKIGLRCFEWLHDGSYQERPFKKWSGGEKRRITLAIDWALSARLAQRAHAECSFLALDEVDRGLDPEGRESLANALRELVKEKETVVVVSHNDELQHCYPDKKWIVNKTASGSTLTVVDGSVSTTDVVH